MPQCIALTKKGHQCTNNALSNSLCGKHGGKALVTIVNPPIVPEVVPELVPELVPTVIPTVIAQPLEEIMVVMDRAQRIRNRKIAERTRILEQLSTPNVRVIEHYSKHLMELWKKERIPGLDCVRAYTMLRYKSLSIQSFPMIIDLLKASASVYFLSNNRHPNVKTYAEVPEEEKTRVLNALHTALVPFGAISLQAKLPEDDLHTLDVYDRIMELEAAEIAVAEAAAEAERLRLERVALEAERVRLFHIRDRTTRVEFERDPEKGINLAAFARDKQNIHRSSVQDATEKAIRQLMTRPVDPDLDTMAEIVIVLQESPMLKDPKVREKVITELYDDAEHRMAFSIPYRDVLARVWTYIQHHKERLELLRRFVEEISEGLGECNNGKMARLINVLQGYDETLTMEVPPMEVFQTEIAKLRAHPEEVRGMMAIELFERFSIPATEQLGWLEALED